MQDLRNKVRLARRDLVQQPGAGAEPSVAAITTHTRLTEDEVRDGLQALDGFSACPWMRGACPQATTASASRTRSARPTGRTT
nr:hypothetical protein [Streptomyces sp. NBC_00063]